MREIHPIHQREDAEVVGLRMDDMGVPAREEREGASGADDINRLPEAVKHQHGLIERSLHTGFPNGAARRRCQATDRDKAMQAVVRAPDYRHAKGLSSFRAPANPLF